MSLIFNIFTYISSDIIKTIITLLILYFVYKILKMYYLVFTLPPGPIPLPLLGNVLSFRSKMHYSVEILKISKKYGPVFTLWMGSAPAIIISDIDIARETFRKNEFSGRIETEFVKQISDDKFRGVAWTDYSHTWEALRKVAHSAVQKLSINENLKQSTSDCVDRTFKLIIDNKDMDKPLDPLKYIFYTSLNVYAMNCFGKRYDIEDTLVKQATYLLRYFGKDLSWRVLIWELSPIMRLIDRKMFNKQKQLIKELKELAKFEFIKHYSDYDESVVRDICDSLISARNDVLREGKSTSRYLTVDNLALTLLEQFFTGIEANHLIVLWFLLLLSYYPKVQKKLRQEIESEIGVRSPTQEDRNRCHYVMAFITETLRFRNISALGVFHKTVKPSVINDKYSIPQGIGIIVYQGSILMDEKYWLNGDQFRPERFLENGEYIKVLPKTYIPFGVGRRVCLGESLAYVDLFAILVRFLQLTSDIILHSHNDLDADPKIKDTIHPKPYKVIFKMP